ncbi:MAG: hypothetical protein K2M06_09485 [Muribaculaceae bacterium]|nr:hypothetical protein [Muribaculaceae bacterium]
MKKTSFLLFLSVAACALSAPLFCIGRPLSSTPKTNTNITVPQRPVRVNVPTHVRPLTVPKIINVKLPPELAAQNTFNDLCARKDEVDPMEWLGVYYLIVGDSASMKIGNYSRAHGMALKAADNYLEGRNPSPLQLEQDYEATAEAYPALKPARRLSSHEGILAARALSRYCTAAAAGDTTLTPQDAAILDAFFIKLNIQQNSAGVSGLRHFLSGNYSEAAAILGSLWERYTDDIGDKTSEEYRLRIQSLKERRGIFVLYRKSLESAGDTATLSTLLSSPAYIGLMKE